MRSLSTPRLLAALFLLLAVLPLAATPDAAAAQPAADEPAATPAGRANRERPGANDVETQAVASCTATPAQAKVGTRVTIKCARFQPGERVDLFWPGLAWPSRAVRFAPPTPGAGRRRSRAPRRHGATTR